MFYGNGKPNYFLFTDNQAAKHIATQPNMNDHSRSIDIRHHAIRQDYVNGEMRIGGVATQDNKRHSHQKSPTTSTYQTHKRTQHFTTHSPDKLNQLCDRGYLKGASPDERTAQSTLRA